MCIDYTKKDEVVYLSLNYPEKKNCLDETMGQAFLTNIRKANTDNMVKVIVIQSKHRAFFSSGPRPRDLVSCTGEEGVGKLERIITIFNECVIEIYNSPKITVALINAYAYGGGFNLTLACDRRIALKRAKFLENFHHMGISPDLGSSYLLPQLIGYEKTFDLLIKSEIITAEEAFKLGLVSEVAENKAELETRLQHFLERAKQGYSPAIAATKKLLKKNSTSELKVQMEIETEYLVRLFKQEEIRTRLTKLL